MKTCKRWMMNPREDDTPGFKKFSKREARRWNRRIAKRETVWGGDEGIQEFRVAYLEYASMGAER